MDMSHTDPLAPLLDLGEVAHLATRAHGAIAAAHRRPAALRKSDLLVAESVLRGARLSTLIEGEPAPVDAEPSGLFAHVISVHGLLSPASIQTTATTFRRSPANVLARMDVAAGGDGRPVGSQAAQRIRMIAGLVDASANAHQVLLPQVIHAEIAAHELFGPRSGIIARATARLTAVAAGFDPRGLAVPEVHYNRHRGEYAQVLAGWTSGNEGVRACLEFLLQGWIAGAAEAEAIIRAT